MPTRREPPAGSLPAAGGDDAGAPAPERPHHADHRQRLRERFLATDGEAFADYELLELLLFNSIDRIDTKPLAKQLLADFKSLGAVLAADPARLAGYPRLNARTFALFKAVREASRRLVRSEIENRPVLSSWSRRPLRHHLPEGAGADVNQPRLGQSATSASGCGGAEEGHLLS